MGAEQSKDSSLNHSAAVSGSDFHYESSEDFKSANNVGNNDSGLQPMQDQSYAWNNTSDKSGNGISDTMHGGAAEAVSAYGDIPFALSPAFYVQLNYIQAYKQFHGIDVNYANLRKYDYDFSLERSVIGH